jgi:hypothetical protein
VNRHSTTNIVWFVLLLLAALLVGTMFGIWVGFDPAALSAQAYVEQQQNAIRSLNTFLPALGAVCIALTVALAVLSQGRTRSWLGAAAVCFVVAGLITRFGNQPINAVVITWSPQAPGARWMEMRDTWWHWHTARTLFGIVAISFALIAALGRRP